MNRIALLALFVLGSCTLAHASTAESFQRALERTAASSTQTVTFFEGLGQLEEGVVRGAPLQDALREGGVKASGLLGAFLDGLESVEKSGSRVILVRAKKATVDTGSGRVRLAKRVEIQIKEAGPTQTSVKLKGAKAAKAGGSLHPIRSLKLEVDAAQLTTATLNVGYAFYSQTVSILLTKPATVPETPGLATAVAGASSTN